jgi:glyoxylase-like metal-dependent hydrolase (beta-lactamase superfamily II)
MEIVPGVFAIDRLGVGRAYLYREADRLTLIDTGLAGSAERIVAEIERAGRRPEELAQIVITHHHSDHTGSLADLQQRTGATTLAHSLDAPIVRGERPPPEPKPTGGWALAMPLARRGARPPRGAAVDRELADGDEIDLDGGAKVMHVPGHTMGSIALYLPARKLLFSGDAAQSAFGLGPPSGPFGMFNEDRVAAAASFRKLAELDFDVACFGHGRPLDRDASLAFRRAAEKLGSWS